MCGFLSGFITVPAFVIIYMHRMDRPASVSFSCTLTIGFWQTERRLAQNREAARKSRLRKKVMT
jgi:hypothetical protein